MPLRLLLLATALFATTACSAAPAQTVAARAETSSATEPPARPEPVTKGSLVQTGSGPVGLTIDSRGRVWVANADAGSLSRLNAAGDKVDLTRQVGNAPLRLAAMSGAVWVTVFSDGTLLRLDAVTGKITDTLPIGAEPEGVTAGFGSLWVVLQASAELLRVDPATGQIEARYDVGEAPRLVTAGRGSLWVSDFGAGRILRVNPATGDVRRSGVLCQGPQGMLVRADTVWVACTTDEVLVGVDRRTMKKTAQLTLKGAPDSIAAGAHGQVLVALQKGPTLAVIDPTGPTIVRRDRLGTVDQLYDRANIDVVFKTGRAWVSSYLEDGVYRVTP